MTVVMNTSGGMLTVNLNSFDDRGRRNAIILKDRERSRPLTGEEMRSREVVKLLATHDLCDVSRLEASRPKGGGRLKPVAKASPPAAPATPLPATPAKKKSGASSTRNSEEDQE